MGAYNTRKLCYRKDDRTMCPIYRCPENFGVPDYAHAPLSPKFLTAFCSDWACECSGQIWSS